MEPFYNAAVIWFVAGFVFLLLEFAIPGLILFFFAIGAWVVAILSLFLDLPINIQLLIFLGTTLLTIALFRKWVKKIIWVNKKSSELEDEFIGKTGRAESFIGPGEDGKVDFKGTSWQARSSDLIQEGEEVIITGNESILLFVKSTKSIS
jgi:membrane protein implicated in regulation of membrane protease activity